MDREPNIMWKTALALGTLAFGLAGCAGFNTVESDVSTYSKWAPTRTVGTYAFERLPSQEARARDQERMTGMVNAVMRRVSEQGPAMVQEQDAARLNCADWLWQSWARSGSRPDLSTVC